MGHEINANNNPDYSIIEEPLPEGIKSILIIRESQTKHFGSYNCTVVNEHGNDILEIDLLRQGMCVMNMTNNNYKKKWIGFMEYFFLLSIRNEPRIEYHCRIRFICHTHFNIGCVHFILSPNKETFETSRCHSNRKYLINLISAREKEIKNIWQFENVFFSYRISVFENAIRKRNK